MAPRNAVQRAFDAFGRLRFQTKRGGTWIREHGEVEQSVNLQKSQYSVSYYVNVELAVETQAGKGRIVGRAGALLPPADAEELHALLDIQGTAMHDEQREHQLIRMLDRLTPLLDELDSVRQLAAHDRRGTFAAMGVTGPARGAFDALGEL